MSLRPAIEWRYVKVTWKVSSALFSVNIHLHSCCSALYFLADFCISEANWDCSVMTMTIKMTEISCTYLPRVPLYVIVSIYSQRPHVHSHHESPVGNWMVRWRYLIVHWIIKRVLRSWALVVGIYMRLFPSRLISGSPHFITRNKSIEHYIVILKFTPWINIFKHDFTELIKIFHLSKSVENDAQFWMCFLIEAKVSSGWHQYQINTNNLKTIT